MDKLEDAPDGCTKGIMIFALKCFIAQGRSRLLPCHVIILPRDKGRGPCVYLMRITMTPRRGFPPPFSAYHLDSSSSDELLNGAVGFRRPLQTLLMYRFGSVSDLSVN